jgi:rubrerythrin
MKESLTCEQCGKVWKRELTRGRKPKICKTCFKSALKLKTKTPQAAKPQLRSVPTRKAAVATPITVSGFENVSVVASADDKDPNWNEKTFGLTVRDVFSAFHPKPKNYRELAEQTKNGSTWQCTKCKAIIEVALPLIEPPTHVCSPGLKHIPQPCKRID